MTNSENKICQNCRASFIIDASDFAFYEKIQVPLPTFCPECREQRRLTFRNERSLYKRKCDLCGKEMVSIFSSVPPVGWAKPFKVYCSSCWFSDNWDQLANGRDFDFKEPFFAQFKNLVQDVPKMTLFNARTVNSDWVNNETDDKNCYLNVGGHFNEDCAYNTYAIRSKDCFDNYWIFSCNFCYENIFLRNCYKTFFSRQCFDCIDTIFSYDCRNCQNIIGCAGLRGKSYCIFNEQYSNEDYSNFLEQHPLSSGKSLRFLKEKSGEVILKIVYRDVFIIKSVNCSGNYIEQSKNCHNCWDVEKVENSKHMFISGEIKDSSDVSSVGIKTELAYEVMGMTAGNNVKFSFTIDSGCYNVEYSNFLSNCHDCFGCVGLRDKSHCIFNKQYLEDEYKILRQKIVEHMKQIGEYGEFFPVSLSAFGYNETAAHDYFPLIKEDALRQGFNWNDYEANTQYQFSDYEIPDNINDISDDILGKILKCEISGKAYRIIPMELEFYRKVGLPISRRAPLQRHRDRLALRAPRKLWTRNCAKCDKEIKTVYSPERPEIVYCEKCYQQEIV